MASKKICTTLFFLCSLVALGQTTQRDSTLNFKIDAVNVVGSPSPLSSDETLDYSLRFDRLSNLPKFLGSVDGVRTLQLMPGVQTTGDIASGLYVQGCEPAHNLFLIDNAPIYSPIHLLGFLPVVNSGHMDKISMDKGYISPEKSSRLSSVVSVTSKENIPERVSIEGELTLLSAALSVNVPIKNSGNFIVSSRATFINPILEAVNAISPMSIPVSYSMNDVNVSWNQKFGEKDKLQISGFYSNDNLRLSYGDYEIDGKNNWQNGAVSANWKHKFTEKTSLSTTIYNTIYSDNLELKQPIISFGMASKINDFGSQVSLKNTLNSKIKLNYGISTSYRNLSPQNIDLQGLSNLATSTTSQEVKNLEYGAFAEAQYSPLKWLEIDGGVRYSGVAHQSSGAEPRLNLKFRTSKAIMLTTSYTRQYQYINQVLVSGTGLPSNYFVATTEQSPSQCSDNVTIGIDFKSPKRNLDFSILLYGKKLINQYENSSKMVSLVVEKTPIYSRFERVDGENFGSEFLFKYNIKGFKGWAAYTLGWALRRGEGINGGKQFYASNDRRHDLSIVGSYNLSNRWSLSSAFIFASGNPITLTKGVYSVSEQFLTNYSSKNEARMPNYHRLDFTASYKLKIKWFSNSSLNISCYNIYARRNAIMFSSKVIKEDGKLRLTLKSAALYTILPSVGITFKR